MTIAIAILILLPLAGAAAILLLPARRAPLGIVVAASAVASSALLLVAVADGSRVVLAVGDLMPPLGIVLVTDPVAAVAALVSSAVLLAVQIALAGTAADRWPGTRAALLVLSTGVSLAFTTADLFTMFVAFEIVLLSSYVLLTRAGDRSGLSVAPMYVTVNIVASALFLLAIAAVYGATGHVNLAEVADAWPHLDEGFRNTVFVTLAVVFATKAALLPLGLWLPSTYAAMPPVIGAAAGALLTKVGVVALIRLVTLLPGTSGMSDALLAVSLMTMIGGVVIALGESALHRVLSAHVISQVGFMLIGVSLVGGDGRIGVEGLAGTLLYLAHHVLVKGALLLVAAGVIARTGTLRLASLHGLQRRAPVLVAVFLLAAAALAGLPPTSGFVAKLALLQAGISAGAWAAVAGMVLGSVLTLVSMTKIHTALMGGAGDATPGQPTPATSEAPATPAAAPEDRRAERGALVGAGGLVATAVALAIAAGPAHDIAMAAAGAALDVQSYIAAVLT